jgi:hypothetical protein
MDTFQARQQKLKCVDLIGHYTIKHKGEEPLLIWCLKMIDPAMGWLEIKELTNKEAINSVNFVELSWLTCYPIPQILTYDRGTEFMAEFAKMIENYYGIKSREKGIQSKTHKQMQS